MARIPLLREDDPSLPEEARALLGRIGQSRGNILNIYRAMANRPAAAQAFAEMIRTVYRSGSSLPPRQAELAYLTATVVNDCYY